MSIEQREHIRFSLDIPAFRQTKYGEAVETILHQISVGGCLLEWDENIFVGEEFRVLARLPNRNFLPLQCRAVYVFPENAIGVRFLDITQFEQDLVCTIIARNLEQQGLPRHTNPFAEPKKYADRISNVVSTVTDGRLQIEENTEDILSIEEN